MKVLDASGIINLRDGELRGEFLTVPEVEKEIKDVQARMKFKAAVADGRIRTEEPPPEALETARKASEKSGVLPLLSSADLGVLALAGERGLPVVTDDYDIQNMCLLMGLEFEPVAKPGIKEAFRWSKRCAACGRRYQKDVSECESCGSRKFNVIRR